MNPKSNNTLLNLTVIDRRKSKCEFCEIKPIEEIVAALDSLFTNWHDCFKNCNSADIYNFFIKHGVCHFELQIDKEKSEKYSVKLAKHDDADYALYFYKMSI